MKQLVSPSSKIAIVATLLTIGVFAGCAKSTEQKSEEKPANASAPVDLSDLTAFEAVEVLDKNLEASEPAADWTKQQFEDFEGKVDSMKSAIDEIERTAKRSKQIDPAIIEQYREAESKHRFNLDKARVMKELLKKEARKK